ncbi:hypothetical protein GGI42DRAFT_233365 [Trichoderma sp. SZMC 28013]
MWHLPFSCHQFTSGLAVTCPPGFWQPVTSQILFGLLFTGRVSHVQPGLASLALVLSITPRLLCRAARHGSPMIPAGTPRFPPRDLDNCCPIEHEDKTVSNAAAYSLRELVATI